MPTQIAAMLQSLYVAYREKRLADVAAQLADDFRFTMHLPADALPAQIVQGAVRVRIRYRHKATDAVIETTIGHFWRVRDGKVVQLDEYHNVQHVLAFLHKVASGG